MRSAEVTRKTNETDIFCSINLDGEGKYEIDTGIGFLNHMLELFAKHGLINLQLSCSGDIEVDYHHSVEDVGIVLGQALNKALGDKKGIKRYGTAFVPMDESLAQVSLDISSRPFLNFDVKFPSQKVGEMDTELFEEFFRAFCYNAGMTVHIRMIYGGNSHHIAEAIFKALSKAILEAITIDSRISGVMSTKGTI